MSPVFSHGRLRLYLLKLLEESPRHGYDVIRLLEDRFMGLYAPSPGTIYPRLQRLEAEGLVEQTKEEGGRKVYRITDAGRQELAARRDELDLEAEIAGSVHGLAREIRDEVRGTVRDLKQELKQAARRSAASSATRTARAATAPVTSTAGTGPTTASTAASATCSTGHSGPSAGPSSPRRRCASARPSSTTPSSASARSSRTPPTTPASSPAATDPPPRQGATVLETSAAIEARGLTKTYPKGVRALDGLGFSVEAGTVFGRRSAPTAPASRPPSRSSPP